MPYQEHDRLLEIAEAHITKGLPLVLFNRPDEQRIHGVFQEDDKLEKLQDYGQKGFVFAPFYNKQQTIRIRADNAYFQDLMVADTVFDPVREGIAAGGKVHYIQLLEKAINTIQNSELEKIVLSRSIKAKLRIRPLQLFAKLCSQYKSAYCYLFYHPQVGMWQGATPERLLQLKNGNLKTVSLAGTLPYKEGVSPKWTSKEIEEQAMVTRYILSCLEGLCLIPSAGEPFTIRAGSLWHLKTVVESKLQTNEKLAHIVKSLHPTPAVCGLPKQDAMRFILENEGYDREFYSGYLGEIGISARRHLDFFVNLRCLKIQGNAATIYVGGGITKDSDPESEWQETLNKSRTILDLLDGWQEIC